MVIFFFTSLISKYSIPNSTFSLLYFQNLVIVLYFSLFQQFLSHPHRRLYCFTSLFAKFTIRLYSTFFTFIFFQTCQTILFFLISSFLRRPVCPYSFVFFLYPKCSRVLDELNVNVSPGKTDTIAITGTWISNLLSADFERTGV